MSQHLDVHAKNAFVSMRDVNFPSSDSISSRSDFGSDYSDGNLSHTWWSRSGGKKRKINHPPLPPPPSSPTAFITLFRGSFIGSIYNARHLNLTSTGSIPGYIQLDTSLLPTISSTSAISSASSSSLASRAYIFLEHGSSKINLKKFQPCARFVAHVVGGGGGGGSPIPSPPLGSVSVTGNTKDLVFEKNSPFAKSGYKRGGERDDDGGRTCEGGDDDAAPLVDSSVKIGRSILNFE